MAIGLLRGEKILEEYKPTSLSFISFYAIFAYPLLISIIMFVFWNDLENYFRPVSHMLFDKIPPLLIVIWILMLIPSFFLFLIRIDIKAPLFYLLLSILFTILDLIELSARRMIIYSLIVPSILALVVVELYRRGITYMFTDYRVVIRKRFLIYEERSIPYDKITDVFLVKGILGRIFNYGTIVPITASMVGLSVNTAMVNLGGGLGRTDNVYASIGAARSKITPFWLPPFVIYGVPAPEEIYRFILTKMKEVTTWGEGTMETQTITNKQSTPPESQASS